ncbi:MAG: hypothetical protein AB2689_00010 [Candidatus Thiodiazotropha taylori]
MARKIKETPVLKGKNARAFDRAITSNKSKKVTSHEYKRAEDTYTRIMKASKIA